MRRPGQTALRAAAALLLAAAAGCSTIENAHRQKTDMMRAYEAGDMTAALETPAQKLAPRKNAFTVTTVGTGDELMWRLEHGTLKFLTGDYTASVEEFGKAEEIIAEYDERAALSARDAGSEGSALLTNQNALPYRGYCRDRIMLAFYKALAYLGAERPDAFRAQIKRLRQEQKDVREKFAQIFEEQKAEIEKRREETAAKSDNEADKETKEESSDEDVADKLEENRVGKEVVAEIAAMKQVADRGYGNFLNPAATFLAGLSSLRDEDYSTAAIEFTRLCKAMPKNPLFKRYLVTVLRLAGREVPADLRGVEPFEFSLERDCVFVILANGRGVALRQIAVNSVVMTAWPVCEYYPAAFEALDVTADGRTVRTLPLSDMDGVFSQEFNELLPMMIARILLSTAVKDAAYYGALAAIYNSDMNAAAKGIALLSVAVGGLIYRAAMNTADTRTWETLPKEFQLGQLPMPKDRTLNLNLGGTALTVEIPAACRSAVVFVNAPTAQNVTCGVLPLVSKKEE